MTEPHRIKLSIHELNELMNNREVTVKCKNAPGYCRIKIELEDNAALVAVEPEKEDNRGDIFG